MTDAGRTCRLTSETFLAELVEGLAAVLESALGPQIATSCIGDIGLAVGVRVDRDLKRSLSSDAALTMEVYCSLLEELLRNLYAGARIVEVTADRVSIEVFGSAFRHILVKGREFSDIGASIFGAIAAVNFGFGKVCINSAGTQDGEAINSITIFTADTPEARAVHGEEFYGEVVTAFGNVQTQLQVVEENRLIREQLQESAVEYRDRHRQISALAEIATTVSQSRDPTEILTAGLRMLIDAVGVEVGAIYSVDEETETLKLTYQHGLSPELANEVLFEHVLPQHTPAGHERWEAILSSRRHSPPDWKFGEFQCYASAPMRAKERRLGVVLVLARLRRAFTPLEMELLELVANELGVGMDNIRLYRHLSKQVYRLSNLRDISAQLNRCNRLDQVLDLAAESVTQKLGFDRVGIFLVNEQENSLEQMRGTDEYGHLIQTDDREQVPISTEHGTLARSVIEKRPLHALDVASEEELELGSEEAVGLASLRISAFARVPLIAEGKVVGAISVDNMLHRKPITDEDLHMLMIFGNQVAVAIDNARFTEALERSAEELRKVDAVRSEFVGMISHELRSPLHKLRNAGSILLEGETDRDRAKYARLIVRSTDYLTGLVNNLLAQARIEGAALRVNPHPIQLAPLIDETVQEMRTASLPTEQTVRVDVPENLHVFAEAPYLKLVLTNLISNASKASERDGLIEIWAEPAGAFANVCVKDHGIGISLDRQSQIFERFASFGRDDAEKSMRGVGLGLHICRSLVEAHGGHIEVKSEPGQGSQFCVTIPLANDHLPLDL